MHERCAYCNGAEKQLVAKKRPSRRATREESATVVGEQIRAKPELLSRKEAAEYLGLSEQTLAIWKSSARYSLPLIKVGRLAKYRRSDLDAFLERNTWDGGNRREESGGR